MVAQHVRLVRTAWRTPCYVDCKMMQSNSAPWAYVQEKNKTFFCVFVKGDSILSSRLLKLFVFAANLLGHDPSDSRVCRNALQRNATSVAI